jgi:hypothetical protein
LLSSLQLDDEAFCRTFECDVLEPRRAILCWVDSHHDYRPPEQLAHARSLCPDAEATELSVILLRAFVQQLDQSFLVHFLAPARRLLFAQLAEAKCICLSDAKP